MTAKQAWEEIVCDAMGDMNVFAFVGIDENAPAVLESIKKTANETPPREQEDRHRIEQRHGFHEIKMKGLAHYDVAKW